MRKSYDKQDTCSQYLGGSVVVRLRPAVSERTTYDRSRQSPGNHVVPELHTSKSLVHVLELAERFASPAQIWHPAEAHPMNTHGTVSMVLLIRLSPVSGLH